MILQLFSDVCLYDIVNDETTIYGQYENDILDYILIENTVCELVMYTEYSCKDFYIKIKGKISRINCITFISQTNIILNLENISLYFPFENCDLKLNPNSAIISTMVKDYSHRLDEWINYNLTLGFSGIIIFNNDKNNTNGLNESNEYCIKEYSTEEICKKYKGKVFMVNFPYGNIRWHWNTIQIITLHIGVNAFINKCRNIALIDADEFIFIPSNVNIEDFLQKHSTITMRSKFLTNKLNNDIINNNILKLANYVGNYSSNKVILHTDRINKNEFITDMHSHPTETIMDINDIILYHCWMNNRCNYDNSMEFFDISKNYN